MYHRIIGGNTAPIVEPMLEADPQNVRHLMEYVERVTGNTAARRLVSAYLRACR